MTKALYALYNDAIRNSDDADKSEERLHRYPDDINTRAELIHFYCNVLCKHGGQSSISEKRFCHIAWFIQNKPDLQFCGTAPFYFNKQDVQCEATQRLWEASVNSSLREMRRINACMFVSNVDRAMGLEWVKSLFPIDSNSIWVLALRDLLCDSGNCFKAIVEAEQHTPFNIDDEYRSKVSLELRSNKNWEQTALCDAQDAQETFSFTDYSSLTSNSIISLDRLAKIAGHSMFRIESNSLLGFDPEAISLRFIIACWIIKHVPFSHLASSSIFMSPFKSPKLYGFFGLDSVRSLECLFEHLAELWSNQLHSFPKDKNIARNTACFADECKPFFPRISKIIR